MKLKQTEYKQIEFAADEEYGWVVGTITMRDGKMFCAEVSDSTIFNIEEVQKLRAFLDEVEKAMTTKTVANVVGVDTTSCTIEYGIRCE